jgi:outer membrane receptor protein involved in Fe transport
METRSGLWVRAVLLSAAISAVCDAPADAQTASDEQEALAEIVVTARKRAENLQQTPLGISVVTSDFIRSQAITNIPDLARTISGFKFNEEFGRRTDRPVIRGQTNILGESGVSYTIDGVYYTGTLLSIDLDDVERFEVIKGPQSALYGRNAYSGAISITTPRPGDTLATYLKASIAQRDQYDVSGSIRGPISERVGGSLHARYYTHGGEYRNPYDGSMFNKQKSTAVSGALVLTPSEAITLDLRVSYSEQDDGPVAIFLQPANQNNCFFDNGAIYAGGGQYFCGTLKPGIASTDVSTAVNDKPGFRRDQLFGSARLDWKISDTLTLTGITGFLDIAEEVYADNDYLPSSLQVFVFNTLGTPLAGTPGPYTFFYSTTAIDNISEYEDDYQDILGELRLSYDGGALKVMGGLFYYQQKYDELGVRRVTPTNVSQLASNLANVGVAACQANPLCTAPIRGSGPVTFDNYVDPVERDTVNRAIFAEVSYSFNDRFTASLEGRYSEEEIDTVITDSSAGQTPRSVVPGSATFTSFLPRATLNYRLADTSILYAVAGKGSKPGGFNAAPAIAAGIPTYDEQDAWSYELGLKNTLWDGQAIFNVATFYTKVSGYQLSQPVAGSTSTFSVIVNAGDVDTWGAEFEFNMRPSRIPGLTASLNYTYLDSEFQSGVDQIEGALNDVADDGLANCSTGDQFPTIPGCQSKFGSIVGKKLPRVPSHAINALVRYQRPFGASGWEWYIGGDASLEYGDKWVNVHNYARFEGARLFGAQFGIENEKYALQFWGKNIFDDDSLINGARFFDADRSFRRAFIGTLRPQSQWGATFTARF